jgi:hypothetical protein
MNISMRTLWVIVLALWFGFAAAAQQQVNNFRVLTNLYVGNAITGATLNGYNIDAIATNSAAAKLDTTNGTPVVAGVSIGTNTLAKLEINGLFPLPADSTNFWASGDSQTFGEYNNVQVWTDGSKRLYSIFRWPNILATTYGLNLTNRAVSGSRLARTSGASDATLAQLNVLGVSFSGLVTVASGYNDADTSSDYGNAPRTRELFYRGMSAVIARVLAVDYSNAQGLRPDGSANASWSTAGSVTDESLAGKAYFPVGSPTTNTVKVLTLTGTQTLSFAATNAAVWLETSSAGGTVQLYYGTNLLDTVSLAGGSTYNLPAVLLGRDFTGTFTVTNVSGSNRILAAGSLGGPAAMLGRTVVVAAPLRLGAANYSDQRAAIFGNAYRAAAQDWNAYRVYFADANSRMMAAMIPSNDTSHPDPAGQKQILAAVVNAVRSPTIPADSAPAMRYTDGGFEIHGAQGNTTAYIQTPGVFFNTVGNDTYFDFYNPATATFGTAFLRANNLNLSQGGLQVQSGFDSVAELQTGNYGSLAHQGGILYIASQTNNGTTLSPLPVVVQSKGVLFEGFIMASSGPASLADYPTNSTIGVLSQAGGIVYLQALTSSGTVQTNEPLIIRAKRVQAEGPMVVTGVASSASDYPTNTSLRLQRAGAVSYIDAGTYDGTNDTPSEIQLRGAPVIVTGQSGVGGGFGVQGSFAAITNYPTNKFLAFAISGGEAYIDAYDRTGGTSLAGLPMNLRGSAVKIASQIELGAASDTTLSRLSAGRVAVEGIALENEDDVFPNTQTTITYSTTNVTVTIGGRKEYSHKLTLTNNCQLTFSGGVAADRGIIELVPAATNITILLASPARSTTGQTLTITAAGSSTNSNILAWQMIGSSIYVNVGAYYR